MLTKSKVAFDEMSLYDCRKAFGLPVYDIEVVMQDIRDIDCECNALVLSFRNSSFGRAGIVITVISLLILFTSLYFLPYNLAVYQLNI